jgi:IS5 family transposase
MIKYQYKESEGRIMRQLQLFGAETQLERLKELGDPLIKINELIDWEMFRRPIETAIRKDMSKGGRPPYDVVTMYKITMLQQWYGLSDMGIEYQINDRFSFLRFLGLEVGDKVPDGNTIWDFKEALKDTGVDRKLFDLFNEMLEERDIVTHRGSIVDASFVTVPKRHTTKKDNEHLKAGEDLEDLPVRCEERLAKGEIKDVGNVTAQIDTDARWTKKNNESFFGYKDHVKCDSDSKIITDFSVTDASVHDSQEFVGLIDENDNDVKADSGYVGESFEDEILKKYPHIRLYVCARAYRNTPLTDGDKAKNREISHTRARIEHIFGYMTRFMAGITSRVHGLERVKRDVTAKNLAYNLRRYVCIVG